LEVSAVKRRVLAAITEARKTAQERRGRADAAEAAYGRFLQGIATPVARQIASVLKAEGHTFTVSTPGRGLRLDSDRGRDDFVEIELRAEADPPEVVGRIRRTRGSRTVDEEHPIRPGTPIQALTEEDVLEFFVRALGPWLEH
jgi:hypothetical protein